MHQDDTAKEPEGNRPDNTLGPVEKGEEEKMVEEGRNETEKDTLSPILVAEEEKIKGNKFVSRQKWDMTLSCYRKGIEVLNGISEDPSRALHVALLSNAALALLKLEKADESELECTKAIDLDPKQPKIWYRRAQAKEAQLKSKMEGGGSSQKDYSAVEKIFCNA